ncbi:hypothetical protein IIU_05372 [Bacillus cereus VD133]|uniref:Uncharacterized protein n=1 Tax=Bacillus cereus VD133 TaxID=1053233 RepID=A0A9W5PML3_BACCE|nr:hypothetical protein [Bacillus cereus]EOO29787.1 hypothetical protein IIU_05372 [Bacillus cereus VD133]
MENKVKKRTDLIGLIGFATRKLTIIDAEGYPTEILVCVSDNMDLEDIELDSKKSPAPTGDLSKNIHSHYSMKFGDVKEGQA